MAGRAQVALAECAGPDESGRRPHRHWAVDGGASHKSWSHGRPPGTNVTARQAARHEHYDPAGRLAQTLRPAEHYEPAGRPAGT